MWSEPLTNVEGEEDYSDLIGKLAREITERQLAVPAIVLLESIKPLSFLGNQLLIFANPVVSLIVSSRDYYRFVRMIEDRENVERLTRAIEEENAILVARQREARRERRRRRRPLLRRLFGKGGSGSENEKEVGVGGRQGDHQDTGD